MVNTDIRKAFDSISHQKLIKMVDSYGVGDVVTDWLRNFLYGRSQQVVVENVLSSPVPVTSGVPQDSVIGPLLFIIYFNDVTATANQLGLNGSISLFADDAKLYSTDIFQLQSSLNTVTSWL